MDLNEKPSGPLGKLVLLDWDTPAFFEQIFLAFLGGRDLARLEIASSAIKRKQAGKGKGSLTEAVAVTRREALVGATDWCTHPQDLDVTRVRGTKNPDRAAVAGLHPELVLAVQEENRELDVRRLRAAGQSTGAERPNGAFERPGAVGTGEGLRRPSGLCAVNSGVFG